MQMWLTSIRHRGIVLASHQMAPGWILGIQNEKIDLAEIYRRHCLKEGGQRLGNADRTHLELASGKLVLRNTSLTRKVCSVIVSKLFSRVILNRDSNPRPVLVMMQQWQR